MARGTSLSWDWMGDVLVFLTRGLPWSLRAGRHRVRGCFHSDK